MMSRYIAKEVELRLLTESRFRCCICPEHRREIQIHHINRDPTENSYENLIVVCANCHTDIHTKGDMYRNLTSNALIELKNQWIKICSSYEGFMKERASQISQYYILNVPWIVKNLEMLSANWLHNSPISYLLEKDIYLWERASSLNHHERMSLTVHLERAIQTLVAQAPTILLSDIEASLDQNNYVDSQLVLFWNDFFVKGIPSPEQVQANSTLTALMHRTSKKYSRKIKTELNLDPRFLVSVTSFVNLSGRGIYAGVAMPLGVSKEKDKSVIRLRPLAIGSASPRLSNLTEGTIYYDEFKYYQSDMMKYIKEKIPSQS